MPVYRLPEDPLFPPASHAVRSGLLAVGGDLSPVRLLAAYREGIFPWYSAGEPILWWSPDPRFVLFPEELRVSRSMRQFLRQGRVRITYDRAFKEVVAACGEPRPGQDGTWITPEMQAAYGTLHDLGYAHSIEAWEGGQLSGGLYGVSLGSAFFGESMFTRLPNASKAALITLVGRLEEFGFSLIDCQVETAHLTSLGARPIPRKVFLTNLREALRQETLRGSWEGLLACCSISLGPKTDSSATIK
ncbi:MAG: leucyl/phenylalanyl-tRNA--protein transferase [Syntrophaceae bacterium]|nr:leucyl/phenylalanyl-tRNA--protein transferase [Syntrophaceae bacterium]